MGRHSARPETLFLDARQQQVGDGLVALHIDVQVVPVVVVDVSGKSFAQVDDARAALVQYADQAVCQSVELPQVRIGKS